jgi:hypothetical protein
VWEWCPFEWDNAQEYGRFRTFCVLTGNCGKWELVLPLGHHLGK